MKTFNNKICHISSVHNCFDPRIFYKECASLAKKYEVSYIVKHDKRESIKNVRIIPFPTIKPIFFRIIFSPVLMFFYAFKERAEIYHVHDPELLITAPFLKFFLGCKIIYDIHEDYYTSISQKRYLNSVLSKAIPPIYRNIERFFVQNVFDKVVIAEKYYREFIPNGIEILNYPLEHGYPERKYSRETEEIQLLYTGTVTLDRGALICANIPNFVKNCKVSFVGRCKRSVAEKIYNRVDQEDNIEIVGIDQFVSGEVIDKFYARNSFQAGLAIFPRSDHYFKKELTKFFEYMGAGLPIIASNFPAWKRLIEGNSCGICVDPDDTEQIASAVTYICNHPEAAKTMGENGRKAVELKYSWEIEEQNLFKLYENLFSSMKKRGNLLTKGDTD